MILISLLYILIVIMHKLIIDLFIPELLLLFISIFLLFLMLLERCKNKENIIQLTWDITLMTLLMNR